MNYNIPIKLQDHCSIGCGKAQETHPSQEDTAEHAGVEVQYHHLKTSGDAHYCDYILIYVKKRVGQSHSFSIFPSEKV